MMDELKKIWNELTLKYPVEYSLIEELWAEIEKEYSTENRYYHNLAHLYYMIDKVYKFKDRLKDIGTIMFSIFYHDIVYDTNRQDNEQRSAMIATDRLAKLGLPVDKILKCQNQILATKGHETNADNDTNYLIDIDLAILGEIPENYKDYAKKIRSEYSSYPSPIYNDGRKKVLQSFLDMDRIFKTDECYQKYERQARENLKAEINEL